MELMRGSLRINSSPMDDSIINDRRVLVVFVVLGLNATFVAQAISI
jgi:hypothetical protein